MSNVSLYGMWDEIEREDEFQRIKAELDRVTDPTYRKRFDLPGVSSKYVAHCTDDKGVKDAAKAMDAAISYLKGLEDSHRVQSDAFEKLAADRREAESVYREAANAAVVAGKPVPDAPDYTKSDKALSEAHRALDKLELSIPMAEKRERECVAAFNAERERLYTTAGYRKWADAEAVKMTDAMAKAIGEFKRVQAERARIFGNLGNSAHADAEGVAFVEPASHNSFISIGDYDPRTPIQQVEDEVIVGNGVRPWMLSQLTPEQQEDYKKRVAKRAAEGVH